jgi:CheY-like chemotaxis protein
MARILIIEDDDHCRELLRLMLEPAGHAVVDACNGREGLARYRAAPTDVVVLDLFMPEQEGLETIQALRREYPTVKIIAISGGDRTGTLDLVWLKISAVSTPLKFLRLGVYCTDQCCLCRQPEGNL